MEPSAIQALVLGGVYLGLILMLFIADYIQRK